MLSILPLREFHLFFKALDFLAHGSEFGASFGGQLALFLFRTTRIGAFILFDLVGACRQQFGAIAVEIAIIGEDGLVLDHPQTVDAGFHEMAVMADEDDGTFIFVERLNEHLAAVHIQMIGRFVKDQQMWTMK